MFHLTVCFGYNLNFARLILKKWKWNFCHSNSYVILDVTNWLWLRYGLHQKWSFLVVVVSLGSGQPYNE